MEISLGKTDYSKSAAIEYRTALNTHRVFWNIHTTDKRAQKHSTHDLHMQDTCHTGEAQSTDGRKNTEEKNMKNRIDTGCTKKKVTRKVQVTTIGLSESLLLKCHS